MSCTHLHTSGKGAYFLTFPECSYLGKILKATIKELSAPGREASQPKQQLPRLIRILCSLLGTMSHGETRIPQWEYQLSLTWTTCSKAHIDKKKSFVLIIISYLFYIPTTASPPSSLLTPFPSSPPPPPTHPSSSSFAQKRATSQGLQQSISSCHKTKHFLL